MNRFHKLLLIILGVTFLVWADQEYAQYKMKQKYQDIIDNQSKAG